MSPPNSQGNSFSQTAVSEDGSSKDIGPLFLATLNEFKSRVDVMESFVQNWTGGMRDHVAVLEGLFCEKVYPAFRDEVSRLKGVVRENEISLASSRKEWMQYRESKISEVAVLCKEKAQLSEKLQELENMTNHRQQQVDVTLEHSKAEAAEEKKKLLLRLDSTQKTVERLLKAYRGLDAKKMDVEQKYTKVLRESAKANMFSADEATGQCEIKRARKSMSDIQVEDGQGWTCKQDGPFRVKKLKQLQLMEQMWRREAAMQCPNNIASSLDRKDYESRPSPPKAVEHNIDGWEVEPATVLREQVGDFQEQQRADLEDSDGCTRGPQSGGSRGTGVVTRDAKMMTGRASAPEDRKGTSGALRMEGFRTSKAQLPEGQAIETGKKEVTGEGSRVVFERHPGTESALRAFKDRKARPSTTGRPEKQLKWLSTRSGNDAEMDAHEDFLSTPQRKVLSTLSDQHRGGMERSYLDPISEQECRADVAGKENCGIEHGKLSDYGKKHGEGVHHASHPTRNERMDVSRGATGCSQEFSHRGRKSMEHAGSGEAGGGVGRCITEDSTVDSTRPGRSRGREGGDGRVPTLASDAGKGNQTLGVRLAGQKDGGTAAPAYKYNAPVRKRAEREGLVGVECKQCQQFYKAVQAQDRDGIAENRCEHFHEVSRHRYFFPPPATPEGFWNIGFDTDG